MANFSDNFSKQASIYAQFRPSYPHELYDYLSSNYVGFCAADIETSVKNHLIGFAAEEARITDRVVYMADYLQI